MPYNVLNPALAAAAPVSTAGDPLTSQGETLLSYRTDLIASLQGRLDAAVSPTRLNLWINRAYRHASFMVDMRRLWTSIGISVVAEQGFYLLPTDLAWIKEIAVADTVNYSWYGGRGFEQIDLDYYRSLPVTYDSDRMLSRKYLPFNQMIVLWPLPIDAWSVVLDYRIRVRDLVADTDSPILPPEFHESIALLALGRAQRSLGMRDAGDRSWNDGISLIRSTINTDAEERDGMEMRLQPITKAYQQYRRRG